MNLISNSDSAISELSSMTHDKTYCYLFIRRDLSVEQQIIQASHAAMQMAFSQLDAKSHLDNTPNIVLVGADNKEHIELLQSQLQKNAVEHESFYEPDINLELTAIACAPLRQKQKVPFLKKQKIAKC